jgi:hypothetical protein
MTDILLDENNELGFYSGDLASGESTRQHQQLLLLSNKGDWREYPTVGVGLAGYLKDDDFHTVLSDIKSEFQTDGMRIKTIALDESGNLNIDATYGNNS